MPSGVGRIPIKITGTDNEGNDLELSFHIGGDPMLADQTQINPNKPKNTQNHLKPPKTTQNNPKQPLSKVGVLTDQPPGTPSSTAQIQNVVNTVGPVPMTFGYGPNTFPHSAAHVLNTNHSPSNIEGEQINEIYASVAPPLVKHLIFKMNHPTSGGDRNHKYSEHTQNTSGVKINDLKLKNNDTEYVQIISGVTNNTNSSFNNARKNPFNTGSNLDRGVPIQNTHPKNLIFTHTKNITNDLIARFIFN